MASGIVRSGVDGSGKSRGGTGAATSDEFYGDSDADENPFEHDDDPPPPGSAAQKYYSSLFVSSNSPDSSVTDAVAIAASQQSVSRDSFRGMGLGVSAAPTTTTTSIGALPWGSNAQQGGFPSNSSAATSFPTIVGGDVHYGAGSVGAVRSNNRISSNKYDRAGSMLDINMVDTEVETETEGETENEESDDENYLSNRNGKNHGITSSGVSSLSDWSRHGEKEWIALIDQNLKRARMGQADALEMRQLLRRAGFVPASRRKDIWRLLILGRVEPSTGGGGNGITSSRVDLLALDASILSTELDMDNQRVVRVDVERTRPTLDQFKRPRVKNMLARVLTHHCKTQGLGYKQGMHEVLAPFVALSDPELPTSDISLCYSAFIKRFLPYAFNKDEEFLSLQICFRLFRLLLLYHHPRLCRFLDQYQLQPELYATPWFLTLFANSLDLPRLYEVWDFYLFWGDPALHHFVVLAFVIGNAEVILQTEEANLPETVCRLSVGMRSVEELRALMLTAKDLMLNTPKSFRKILRSALYANLSQSQLNLVLNTLQVSSCIPVSAEEVISYILHKNPHRHLDQESDDEAVAERRGSRAKNARSPESPPDGRDTDAVGGRRRASPSPQRMAEQAAMRSLRGHRQYIILDCRHKDEFEACRLAPALHLDPELLISPDDLDAKLKEFMPLQGAAHFCLVGTGGDVGLAGRQRKNSAPPSDLSGEAMGLRPQSIKTDSTASSALASGGASPRGDLGGDWSVGFKPAAGGPRDGNKDGGFNWMGGFSRALSRAQGDGGEREGEEKVGKEEDVQVARFVLMLLQYNFPYISHVRGDMAACLEELSAQAAEEKEEQLYANGDFHEALHGVLIGTEADSVREELTRCSPEKKAEGLFAGLARWSKEKGDPKNAAGAGTEGQEARKSSCRGKDAQARDRVTSTADESAEAFASRGRGGMGRRDTADLFVDTTKLQDTAGAEAPKSSKRRLFGGVMNRFDKGEKKNANAGGGESPPFNARRWRRPSGTDGATLPDEDGVSSSALTTPGASAPGSAACDESAAFAEGGKPGSKGAPTPDRFARFLGKMLGVRDDALPDEAVLDGVGGAGFAGDSSDRPVGAQDGAVRRDASRTGEMGGGGGAGFNSAASQSAASDGAPSVGDTVPCPTTETAPVTATAVFPATAVTTATANAMPVAVAVAMPVTDGTAMGSDAATASRRSSRNSRTRRTGASSSTTGSPRAGGASTAERDAYAVGTGEAVSISEWVAKEQRESGRHVRVFSAQRVLEGKVQKKCRLAVSPKNMTQFDDLQEGDSSTGGMRGVITEHRGLRHLSRITSRKKHADLIVFHFKSRSGSGATGAATASGSTMSGGSASSASGSRGAGRGGVSSTSSRRPRSARATSENDSGVGQADVLFYFMKNHAECLRMVKENYRKVTQGASGSTTATPSAMALASSSSRRAPGQEARGASSQETEDSAGKSGRQAVRRTAGAAAGAAGIVVGAAAGMAVGAAAGVAVGAAFLAGHRKGSHPEMRSTSSSPSRGRRRGGSEGPGGVRADAETRRNVGGWIPIDTPPGEQRSSDASRGGSGGGARPLSASGGSLSRRPAATRAPPSSSSNSSRDHGRSARGASRTASGGSSSTSRAAAAADGPSWLSRR